jgi:NAD+ synthase (glutamine-hydrolysing)
LKRPDYFYHQLFHDVKRLTGINDDGVLDHKAIASKLIFTAYLQSDPSSSNETKELASSLAAEVRSTALVCPEFFLSQVGSNHVVFNITKAWMDLADEFSNCIIINNNISDSDEEPLKFLSEGGSSTEEDTALQNIQARMRMVSSYFLAQLLPYRLLKKSEPLLVLATGNVDEALRGYLTKYDCSSGDINPIGSISKKDLKVKNDDGQCHHC